MSVSKLTKECLARGLGIAVKEHAGRVYIRISKLSDPFQGKSATLEKYIDVEGRKGKFDSALEAACIEAAIALALGRWQIPK